MLFLAEGAPGPSTQARIITVQDTLDDPQALGYHTQDGSEHIWGVVGTQAAMSNGAQALTGKYAISTILSHEVAEMFMDPFCSLWADTGTGFAVAFEIGDPVQSDTYDIDGVAGQQFRHRSVVQPDGRPDRPVRLHEQPAWPVHDDHRWLLGAEGGRPDQPEVRRGHPEWLRQVKAGRASRTQRIKTGVTSAFAGM